MKLDPKDRLVYITDSKIPCARCGRIIPVYNSNFRYRFDKNGGFAKIVTCPYCDHKTAVAM